MVTAVGAEHGVEAPPWWLWATQDCTIQEDGQHNTPVDADFHVHLEVTVA